MAKILSIINYNRLAVDHMLMISEFQSFSEVHIDLSSCCFQTRIYGSIPLHGATINAIQ